MSQNNRQAGTLGPISAQLIRAMLNEGKTLFTLHEAAQILNKRNAETSDLLGDLVNKSVLARIKNGIYIVLQTGSEETQLSNWPIIAKTLAGSSSYYLSHYSAMRLHGMTTHALFDVYISSAIRHRNKELNGIRYHFVYRKSDHFWGLEFKWVTKQDKVFVSDLERTLLDAFERPELCGGVAEICRGIWSKQSEFNWDRLTRYAEKYPTKAAVKRLGFILELLNLAQGYSDVLQHIISESSGYNCLDPLNSNNGEYSSRWHIRVNVEVDEIVKGVWG